MRTQRLEELGRRYQQLRDSLTALGDKVPSKADEAAVDRLIDELLEAIDALLNDNGESRHE
jgi:hypothetical protein